MIFLKCIAELNIAKFPIFSFDFFSLYLIFKLNKILRWEHYWLFWQLLHFLY